MGRWNSRSCALRCQVLFATIGRGTTTHQKLAATNSSPVQNGRQHASEIQEAHLICLPAEGGQRFNCHCHSDARRVHKTLLWRSGCQRIAQKVPFRGKSQGIRRGIGCQEHRWWFESSVSTATLLHATTLQFFEFLLLQHSDNWTWRFEAEHCDLGLAERMAPGHWQPHVASVSTECPDNKCVQNGRTDPEGYQFLPKHRGKGICMWFHFEILRVTKHFVARKLHWRRSNSYWIQVAVIFFTWIVRISQLLVSLVWLFCDKMFRTRVCLTVLTPIHVAHL